MKAWAYFFSGLQPYDSVARIQEAVHALRLADKIPDTVLFLEHTPVVSLGRRGRDSALLHSRAHFAEAGIEVLVSSRGGDATYHGPGQWVMYPIFKLGSHGEDSHGHLNNLEETAIRTCAHFGVEAYRRDVNPGAWTAQGKIAAIGFQIKRWVTLHGISLNVKKELPGFDLIVPCGIQNEGVTSLERHLPENAPSMTEVRDVMLAEFACVSGRTFTLLEKAALPPELSELLLAPPETEK